MNLNVSIHCTFNNLTGSYSTRYNKNEKYLKVYEVV